MTRFCVGETLVYNNLDVYLMMHQEILREMERRDQRHLRNRPLRQGRQNRRFTLRRLLFFL